MPGAAPDSTQGDDAVKTIDYIYRFDPKNPSVKQHPPDAEAARRTLEDGNRMFSMWMESCRTSTPTQGTEPQYVVPCNGLEVGMVRSVGEMPRAAPFAVVVGCSDARVPTEMIFGQGFNDLFVIRVAGNVLGDECLGSVDYALNVLSESVKVVIVLGHSGCGAVTAAVDAYLKPLSFWSKSRSNTLRGILQRIFVAVREAANALAAVWGADAPSMPGYREALIETAVCVNTVQAAYDLHVEVERAGKWEIEVYYGVYNLFTHQVSMTHDRTKGAADPVCHLALAPTNPREFNAVAVQVARRMLQAHQVQTAAIVAAAKPSNGQDGNTSEHEVEAAARV
jgi:carbonic anhydrase